MGINYQLIACHRLNRVLSRQYRAVKANAYAILQSLGVIGGLSSENSAFLHCIITQGTQKCLTLRHFSWLRWQLRNF